MKIKFIGAAGRVTGSCSLLHYQRTGLEFLVDCGMVQGEPNDRTLNTKPWPFVPKSLSFILLTHAHLDHCGLIPRLYKEGFTGKIICTRFTAELADLNLRDAAKQEGSLYSVEDVRQLRFDCIDDREAFGFSRRLPIANDLFVSFLRSAHIGGACGITVSWMDKADSWSEISFSGDVGNNTKGGCYQSLLSHRQAPINFPKHMVLESTYGDRKRPPEFSSYDGRIEQLGKFVRSSLQTRNGPLIIPCFSIHRTQEILVDLHIVLTKLREADSTGIYCGPPLLKSAEIVDQVLQGGLSLKHVEGKTSLIAHWTTQQQEEWLSWFIRVDGESEGKPWSKLMPRDLAEETLAIARTKLEMLRKKQKRITVILDSPLALKMCGVYASQLIRRQKKNPTETMYRNRDLADRLGLDSEDQLDELLEKLLPGQENGKTEFPAYDLVVATAGKRQDKPLPGPDKIFVTGGGMCDGGPVIEHLCTVLTDENATVLLTGYAPPQSIAGKLRAFPQMDNELKKTEKLNVSGYRICYADIKADIADIGPYYSGHADQESLVDYLFEVRATPNAEPHPTRVFLNHGDDRKRKPLADAIRARAEQPDATAQRSISGIEIPTDDLRWFDLEEDAWVDPPPSEVSLSADVSLTNILQDILAEQRKTNDLLSQWLQLTRSQERGGNSHLPKVE